MSKNVFKGLLFSVLAAGVLASLGCQKVVSSPAEAKTPVASQLLPAPEKPDGLPSLANPQPSGSFDHDTTAFTQGLVFHEGRLIEGTGHYGESKLRVLDSDTGKLEKEVALSSDYFGEGVAILDDQIFQLTWRAGVCLRYDLDLKPQGQLFYSTQGWGLTVDPQSKLLVLSDGSSVLRFLDPKTLITRSRVSVTDGNGVPVARLNELEWVRGEIWANVWTSDAICRIDPSTGEVRGWIQLRELVEQNQTTYDDCLNGIAYDPANDRLWLTGKWWPKIYRFDQVESTFFASDTGARE